MPAFGPIGIRSMFDRMEDIAAGPTWMPRKLTA
jgi:hypothetical protein